jgi:hypothetical protein
MTRLQEQLDELDLLESVFSSPGEFVVEDGTSREQAEGFVKLLSPDPPRQLCCRLHIPVSAHRDSEGDGSDDEECVSSASTEHVYSVTISFRLSNR